MAVTPPAGHDHLEVASLAAYLLVVRTSLSFPSLLLLCGETRTFAVDKKGAKRHCPFVL